MRFRQCAALEVPAHVHLEPEPPPSVDELDREEGLVGLAPHQRVLVPEAPLSMVALLPVRGDAALDKLAVGRLDVAKQPVRAAKNCAGLHVTRRREKSPYAPL